jgi:hypothetical protein
VIKSIKLAKKPVLFGVPERDAFLVRIALGLPSASAPSTLVTPFQKCGMFASILAGKKRRRFILDPRYPGYAALLDLVEQSQW